MIYFDEKKNEFYHLSFISDHKALETPIELDTIEKLKDCLIATNLNYMAEIKRLEDRIRNLATEVRGYESSYDY